MKPTRPCSVEGCEKKHYGHGLCGMHYARLRVHGDLDHQRPDLPETCSIEGCEAKREARGWCHTHYTRWWVSGDAGPAERLTQKDRVCSIEDCGKPARGLGYCIMHWERNRKYGDPLTVTRDYRGTEVGYTAAHDRVKAIHGSASGHLCVDCLEPADHWSYDHTDPDEKRAEKGPYSLDIDRYWPRCVTCHRRFDSAFIVACPQGHRYDDENTYVYRGQRHCKECNRTKNRAWWSANRAAK